LEWNWSIGMFYIKSDEENEKIDRIYLFFNGFELIWRRFSDITLS